MRQKHSSQVFFVVFKFGFDIIERLAVCLELYCIFQASDTFFFLLMNN